MQAPYRLPLTSLIAALCLFAAAPLVAQADHDGPPNVLVLQREFLKPGKSGMVHVRSESAFVKAMSDAKYPTSYFALDSMSGPSRAIFVIGYDSFADWEKDNAMMRHNKTLSAAFDRAAQADGELLSGYDTTVALLRPDLSLHHGSLHNTRYFEISLYIVKPGHDQEFEELAKMYAAGFSKADTDTHWDCFQVMYGNPAAGVAGGNAYLVVNTMKSLAETDKGAEDFKKFAAAMGASSLKKAGELEAASVVKASTNLFEINPMMSYPSKGMIADDPGFWKPAPPPAHASAKKSAK